ncbi:uncharacterized protein CEXT_308471 [Caerostris extrusa]|uniref:Uncharacterized protein n=1 Tax=Caerostris extrusa TaxID=172846 RepID=A0AAV4Y8V5_CAEEX|nr:uncharacterized protein CEXT_308471 [Caerostris extrusa]
MTDEAQTHLDRAVSTYEEERKTKKFVAFGVTQKKERLDCRIAATGDLISQGITGLEPALNKVLDVHSIIVQSSGKQTPEEMDDHFKLTNDQANSRFTYLEELLNMIHHTQDTIDELKEKNRTLLMGLSDQKKGCTGR